MSEDAPNSVERIRLLCAVLGAVAGIYTLVLLKGELQALARAQSISVSQSMVEAFDSSDHFKQAMDFAKWHDRTMQDKDVQHSAFSLVSAWQGGKSTDESIRSADLEAIDANDFRISMRFVVSDLTTMLQCVCSGRCEKDTITFAVRSKVRYVADNTNSYWCHGDRRFTQGRPLEVIYEAINRENLTRDPRNLSRIESRIRVNDSILSRSKIKNPERCREYQVGGNNTEYMRCLIRWNDRRYLDRRKSVNRTYCNRSWQEYVNAFEFGKCL